jgi:ABC-2 type transport system ATP-binding protein
MPALETAGLSKRYGERYAVDHVDISLPDGVVSGFVGPNGAGKTTTILMLLGLVRPTEGTAQVLGHPVTHPAAYLPGVGALIEAPLFYPTLSGRRNLEVLTRLGRLDRGRIDRVLEQVELSERAVARRVSASPVAIVDARSARSSAGGDRQRTVLLGPPVGERIRVLGQSLVERELEVDIRDHQARTPG